MTNWRDAERVPAAPFVAWLQRRLEQIGRDDTRRLAEGARDGSVDALADALGTTSRALYRYLRSLDSEGRPVDAFVRGRVEDMLDAAGDVPGELFAEIYPELAEDVEVEPDAYCPACRTDVTPIGGACPWCDTPTGRRQPKSVSRIGQARLLTDEQVRAAHRLHMRGLSIRELGRRLYRQAGYVSEGSAATALAEAFAGLGLERRTQQEATAAANKARTKPRKARPRCPVTTRYGSRCLNYLPAGMRTCRRHTPEAMALNAVRLAEIRARMKPATPMLTEPLIREAIVMHTRFGMSGNAIAKALLPRTRSNSSDVLGRLVRRELRVRGVYEGYKRPNQRKAA